MPRTIEKTDTDKLKDAEELLRRRNAELANYKRVVSGLQREADTCEAIRQEIWGLSAHPPEPPTWISGHGVKNGERGCPVTCWSDFHYGEVIDPDQVGGVNKFNKKIAQERFHTLVDTTIDLCGNHMGRAGVPYPGIVICLGGDLIGGDIHEELMRTNDRTPQEAVNDLTDMIGAGLETMISKFGRVFVPSVVGNHGRTTKKMLMKGRVYTNYDWSIACNLERYFRKEKRIQFLNSNEADAAFTTFGHRFLLTHGDSLGVKGGDGIIGSLGPIMRGLVKLHGSKAAIGQDFDTAIICHYHEYKALPGLIVNGTLKGYDEYAMLGLRAKYQRPTQALTFVHPRHGVTANWPVYLEKLALPAAASKEWVGWQR